MVTAAKLRCRSRAARGDAQIGEAIVEPGEAALIADGLAGRQRDARPQTRFAFGLLARKAAAHGGVGFHFDVEAEFLVGLIVEAAGLGGGEEALQPLAQFRHLCFPRREGPSRCDALG